MNDKIRAERAIKEMGSTGSKELKKGHILFGDTAGYEETMKHYKERGVRYFYIVPGKYYTFKGNLMLGFLSRAEAKKNLDAQKLNEVQGKIYSVNEELKKIDRLQRIFSYVERFNLTSL